MADNRPEMPKEVKQRLDRGRKKRDEEAGTRNLCLEFARGNQYNFLGSGGKIWDQRNIARQQLEPEEFRNRVWQKRNLIAPIVKGKVSAATQRVPSYDITPTTNDYEDIAGARTAQKVALSGYETWKVRRVAKKAVYYALVADESFTLPYWEPDVGPYTQTPEGLVGMGDVRYRVLGRNEVSWEPGVDYEESPWFAVEYAKPVDAIKKENGYLGGDLSPDADARKITNQKSQQSNLVMVAEFFERPCPDYPQGRRLVYANDKQIFPEEAYPLQRPVKGEHEGPVTWEPVDEPMLHRLAYSIDVDSDDDQGLVRHLIDAQRTYNDCVAGETPVVTRQGVRRADELGGEVEILAGDGEWRKAKWGAYGVKPLWRVEFDDGSVVHATENHKWPVANNGKHSVARTPELEGSRVPLGCSRPHMPITDETQWEQGVRNGMVYGDGTICRYKNQPWKGQLVGYGAEKVALVERFFETGDSREGPGGVMVQTRPLETNLKEIPAFDAGFDYLRGFIAGLIATDGGVNANGGLIVSSVNRGDIEAIQTIAHSVGLRTTSIRKQASSNGAFVSGTISWLLTFAKHGFVDDSGVDERLLLRSLHRERMGKSCPSGKVRLRTSKVVSVERTERYEQTYCCEEPVTHTWTLGNFVVTSNSINKQLEAKNLALLVQMMAPRGSMKERRVTTPGAINFYDPTPGGGKPEWATPPAAQILQQLDQIAERAKSDMGFMADSNAIPSNVEAGKAISALIEKDQMAWQDFLADVAEWHSRIMRDSLTLVQHYYAEPRLLRYRGSAGWEPLEDFRGADLRGQTDVRVLPGSIEPRTRQAVEQRIQNIVQMFPGYFPPEVLMSALEGGSAEGLIDDYEKDVARANMIIRKIKQGPDVLFSMPDRQALPEEQVGPDGQPLVNPETGQTVSMVPGWMPRPFDKVKVWQAVFESFMKEADWDGLEPGMQVAAQAVYQGCLDIEARQEARKAAMQAAQAEQLGAQNATRPPQKPMPSLPALDGNGSGNRTTP